MCNAVGCGETAPYIIQIFEKWRRSMLYLQTNLIFGEILHTFLVRMKKILFFQILLGDLPHGVHSHLDGVLLALAEIGFLVFWFGHTWFAIGG